MYAFGVIKYFDGDWKEQFAWTRKSGFVYGAYPYAILPVVTALGPHTRSDFTALLKKSIWLSVEERLSSSGPGIDLTPRAGREYTLNLIGSPENHPEVQRSDLSQGVIWGQIPSAKGVAYRAPSCFLMYTGAIYGYWNEQNRNLIRWALGFAAQGTHHITSVEEGDQPISNTGDLVVDTLKNIDFNTDTNAMNVPWSSIVGRRSYRGILDHLPAVRHIINDSDIPRYVSEAVRHYRVIIPSTRAWGGSESKNGNVFASLFHNSVILYLVEPLKRRILSEPRLRQVQEIVNLKTQAARLPGLAHVTQDRKTSLSDRTDEVVVPIVKLSISKFCESNTTSRLREMLRNSAFELRRDDGIKSWQ